MSGSMYREWAKLGSLWGDCKALMLTVIRLHPLVPRTTNSQPLILVTKLCEGIQEPDLDGMDGHSWSCPACYEHSDALFWGILVNQQQSVALSVNHRASLTCVIIYEFYLFVLKRKIILSNFCPISGFSLQILNILFYFSQSLVIMEDWQKKNVYAWNTEIHSLTVSPQWYYIS